MEKFVKAVNVDHDSWGHDEKVLHHVDSDVTIANWRNVMQSGIGVAYGIEREGGPAGFLLAVHSRDLQTGEKRASEFLWMVSPKHRKGGTAQELLKEFEDDAKMAGCTSIVVGCHAVYKIEVLRRWYKSMGYQLLSESYEKRV